MPPIRRRPSLPGKAEPLLEGHGAICLAALMILLTAAAGRSQGGVCGTAGDELVAAEVGLKREWIVQIPFDSAGWRLQHVVVGDRMVVAQSGDGGIHAVQSGPANAGEPRAGTVLWSQRLGTPGGPATAAGIGQRVVTVARDLDLFALDTQTGRVTWHEPLARPPSLSAVPSGDWVYAPLATEGMLRLPADPLRNPATQPTATAADAAAKAGSKGKKEGPPTAAPERLAPVVLGAGGDVTFAPQPIDGGIIWCTGRKIVALERKPFGWVRREHASPATVATQPLVRGRSIFAAFAPGELRRIDLDPPESQRLRSSWRVTLPDRPVGGPLLAGDTVVVSLGPSGVAGFSATTGEPMWQTDLVGDLVAVCGDRIWLIDEIGRLTGLDPVTGAVQASLCLGCLSMPVLNTTTERLVLASPGGLLVSLAPAVEKPAKAAPAKAKKAGGAQAPPEGAMPDGETPAGDAPDAAAADAPAAETSGDAAVPDPAEVSAPAESAPAPATADPDATPP